MTSLKPGAPTGSEGRHELAEDVLAALARIEFVAPAERTRLRYGSSVDLVAFLATMHLAEAIRSSVGDVVYLIADSLSGASHG
ncbi:hypothetical protein [Frankia sp. EAN1pec]|uniref:hypothetical protein n=1 Tax=Parafrankia sp. (strain EAN1pec) TaxID=298653 RepID=UPI000312ECB5